MLTPLAQTQVHSLGPSHGYCYALVAVNQMYATAPLLQLHSLCSLLCAQTELDLLSCEGEWHFCNCITELCAPRLGKAWAIARAWIPWANGNFIFSITNGWLQLTITKGAPLASTRPCRPPPPPPAFTATLAAIAITIISYALPLAAQQAQLVARKAVPSTPRTFAASLHD